MRATPWPRAANRGRFSFDSGQTSFNPLTIEYVNVDSATLSVRPRGSGDPGAKHSSVSKFWVPASAGTNGEHRHPLWQNEINRSDRDLRNALNPPSCASW